MSSKSGKKNETKKRILKFNDKSEGKLDKIKSIPSETEEPTPNV